MKRSRSLILPGLNAAAVVAVLSLTPAAGQTTTCKTPNCASGSTAGPVLPAECQTKFGGASIAKPRIYVVNMDSNGSFFRYEPANPRIEGQNSTPSLPWDFQCIEWHKIGSTLVPWHSATDNTLGSSCNTATACTATNTYPNPCDFETGNINGGAGSLEWSTCGYRDIPPATYSFECRLHGGLGMTGMLQVVAPINLTLAKSGTSVNLSWTGGSAAGPWDVWKDATAGSAQKMAAPTRLSPTAGQGTRTFSDSACAPTAGNLCAYMVRECNKDVNTGNLCIN